MSDTIHPDPERYSVKILRECIDLQNTKGNDYQSSVSTVRQADYYPRGIDSIYDIMHAKMLRIRSVMDKARATQTVNHESLQDSAKDLINYASFFIAFIEGKIDGQYVGRDMFNREAE